MKMFRNILIAALVALALPASAADLGNGSVFSQTDASNNTGTVPTWAENMAPSQVNDSARALQGAIKRWFDRNSCATASTGSANAYVLTYSVAPVSLYSGERYCFEANFSNTATATLNINSLGATTIQKHVNGSLTNLSANDIYSGDHVEVAYDSSSGVFILVSQPGNTTITTGSVTTTGILDATIATGDIADDAVTLGKMAAGTQGGVIYYGAAGAPTELAAGTDGQVLTTGGAGANPAWEDAPGLTAASQANMEAATSAAVAVTPAVAENHPSAAKAWVMLTMSGGVPSISVDYGIASVDDDGAGLLTLNFDTAFSTSNYVISCMAQAQSASGGGAVEVQGRHNVGPQTGEIALQVMSDGGAVTDSWTEAYCVLYGDQ